MEGKMITIEEPEYRGRTLKELTVYCEYATITAEIGRVDCYHQKIEPDYPAHNELLSVFYNDRDISGELSQQTLFTILTEIQDGG